MLTAKEKIEHSAEIGITEEAGNAVGIDWENVGDTEIDNVKMLAASLLTICQLRADTLSEVGAMQLRLAASLIEHGSKVMLLVLDEERPH